MSEFKPIETQEQLDQVLGERLSRAERNVRKEYEGYLSPEDAQKKYAGYLSPEEVQKKYEGYLSPDEVAEKDKKLKAYETDSAKTRIAFETGLSYEAVGFLKGEDEESIRKSAESLKTLVGITNVAPLASSEVQKADKETEALKNTLKSLKGE